METPSVGTDSPADTLVTAEGSFDQESLTAWDQSLIASAAEAFHNSIGIMFPVYAKNEIEDILARAAGPQGGYEYTVASLGSFESTAKGALLGELSALTAVGLQYCQVGLQVGDSATVSNDQLRLFSRQHYEYARSCLDCCIEKNPLNAMKVFTLLVSFVSGSM